MRLTIKLVSLLTLLAIALVGLYGYLTVQREVELFEAEMRANHHRLATAMEEMVVQIWRVTGQGEALELITRLEDGEQRVRIRWVWLDAQADDFYGPRLSAGQLTLLSTDSEVSFHRSSTGTADELLTYYPIDLGIDRKGALELSESLARRDAYTRATIHRTLLLMGGLVLISGLSIGLIGVRMVGRPLAKLTEKARRVGTGDLTGPVELDGTDELTELGQALNDMCDRLLESQYAAEEEAAERIATLEQLRHADRLRTVGRLASGVAHELGTPLNVVTGRAGMIASGRLSDEEVALNANTIKSEAERMTGIIRQLLDFARRSTPNRTAVSFQTIVNQTLSLLAPLARKRSARLAAVANPEEDFRVEVDVGQMQQVLSNLIMNALQSGDENVSVEVGLRRERATPPDDVELSAGEYVCLFVRDNGAGIPPDVREHLFEPFFTTKPVGEGSGLGLSIAYGIVAEHAGWIEVTSEVGHGSCFSVYLPPESTS